MRYIPLLLLLTGCMGGGGLSKVITAASKDPASVHVSVKSIYVTLEYDRANPKTNSAPHTLKDGVVEVTR